jgi:hypothetical protein
MFGVFSAAQKINNPYTKALLHFNGENESVDIIDSSMYHKEITVNGDAQISTVNPKFGSGCGLFNGSNAYLSLPDSDDWAFGALSFTLETWFKLASASFSVYGICGQKVDSNNWWQLGLRGGSAPDSQNTIDFSEKNAGDYPINIQWSYSSWDNTTWHHLALVRNVNSWRAYVDGVGQGSAITNTTTMQNLAAILTIGRTSATASDYYFAGNLDEPRISNGVAVYTGNFTPQTIQFSR